MATWDVPLEPGNQRRIRDGVQHDINNRRIHTVRLRTDVRSIFFGRQPCR